jgi:hypothetical protein
MIPVSFPEAYTKPLGAGDNPNTGDLPRCVAIDPSIENSARVCAIVSCWKLSEVELAEVNKNGVIYIGVMAVVERPTQPPIWVLGQDPFKNNVFKRVPEEDVKHLGDNPPVL